MGGPEAMAKAKTTAPAVCKACGKTFTRDLLRGAARKYCSKECAERSRYAPVARVQRTCDRCGKAFDAKPGARFCSKECRTAWWAAAFKLGAEAMRKK